MKKQFLTLVLALLVLCLLVGCGGGVALKNEAGSYDAAQSATGAVAKEELSDSYTPSQTATPVNQKLIRTVRMNAETEDLDALLADVEARISELGGYVESRDVYNGTSSYRKNRHASMTIRIPAEKLDLFVSRVSEVSNVVTHTESTQDVTLSYVSTESRIKALQTEEARLLELVSAAKDLKDLLTLEERLTKVRTELEEHTSQLRLYDSLVSYGTIHLYAEEVVEFTEVEEEEAPKTVWQKMGDAFMGSLEALGNILVGLAIFFVGALPFLIPVGLIVLAIVLVIRFRNRRMQKRWQQNKKPE